MALCELANDVVRVVQQNQHLAAPIVFAVAFAESIAFMSLLVPGTVILIAASGMIGASNIAFLPIWLAAGLGGSLGYALSYWIGWYFKDSIPHIWPFTNKPDLLPKGYAFFEKWGALGVFFGHFFGPVRAVIPVVAGMCLMKQLPFQIANISSAFLWAFGVLAPGAFGIQWLQGLLGEGCGP